LDEERKAIKFIDTRLFARWERAVCELHHESALLSLGDSKINDLLASSADVMLAQQRDSKDLRKRRDPRNLDVDGRVPVVAQMHQNLENVTSATEDFIVPVAELEQLTALREVFAFVEGPLFAEILHDVRCRRKDCTKSPTTILTDPTYQSDAVLFRTVLRPASVAEILPSAAVAAELLPSAVAADILPSAAVRVGTASGSATALCRRKVVRLGHKYSIPPFFYMPLPAVE